MSDSKGHKDIKKFNLDQLEKKNIYQVPDKYFDDLPGIIQSRAVKKTPFYRTTTFGIAIKYAFPVACLLIIGTYFGFFNSQNQQPQSFDSLMAEVSYDDLVAYLEDSDISTEEIIASIEDQDMNIEFDYMDVDPFQGFDPENENIEELLDELDINGDLF